MVCKIGFIKSNIGQENKMQNENAIVTKDGEVIRTSRNLRGMRDYARVSPVVKVTTQKDPNNQVRGILTVEYADECTCRASFASHAIMIDFVRARRTWRETARIVHLDGEQGYLTKPGSIAGE
jgi:hypothetical protein